MVEPLGRITLKSGEPMTVIKTTAPEPAWTSRITSYLQHKGELWLEPIERAYNEGLDSLTVNDFLGVLDSGEVVGNITTVEHLGVAILQHVFTPPHHRRKGICNALMQALTEDFRARGGRAMYLGTGHGSVAFRIYESFGFRGRGDSGKMTWLLDPRFQEDWFAPGQTTVRDTRWQDHPLLEALYAVTGQWQLKGFHFNQFGHAGYEAQYLMLRKGLADGSVLDVKVLERAGGPLVGHAFLAIQNAWAGRVLVLDFMVHANYYDHCTKLLSAITIPPNRKVQAFCDERAEAKMAALETLGFVREGLFRRQITDENHEPMDVVVFGLTRE